MGDRERDPYRVLGIGADATGADIARAYRRLARALHPDSRPGDPAAAGQFRALAEAYGVLSDPARRAAWDDRHPRQPGPRAAAPQPASPDLWPFPPAVQPVQPGPPASPLHGPALRAGPVRIEPPARPGRGQQPDPDGDAVRARLLYWLVAGGLEQPW